MLMLLAAETFVAGGWVKWDEDAWEVALVAEGQEAAEVEVGDAVGAMVR